MGSKKVWEPLDTRIVREKLGRKILWHVESREYRPDLGYQTPWKREATYYDRETAYLAHRGIRFSRVRI